MRGSRTADPSKVVRELGPLLPAVATEVLPELISRLNSRVAARTIREVFGDQLTSTPLAAGAASPR